MIVFVVFCVLHSFDRFVFVWLLCMFSMFPCRLLRFFIFHVIQCRICFVIDFVFHESRFFSLGQEMDGFSYIFRFRWSFVRFGDVVRVLFVLHGFVNFVRLLEHFCTLADVVCNLHAFLNVDACMCVHLRISCFSQPLLPCWM